MKKENESISDEKLTFGCINIVDSTCLISKLIKEKISKINPILQEISSCLYKNSNEIARLKKNHIKKTNFIDRNIDTLKAKSLKLRLPNPMFKDNINKISLKIPNKFSSTYQSRFNTITEPNSPKAIKTILKPQISNETKFSFVSTKVPIKTQTTLLNTIKMFDNKLKSNSMTSINLKREKINFGSKTSFINNKMQIKSTSDLLTSNISKKSNSNIYKKFLPIINKTDLFLTDSTLITQDIKFTTEVNKSISKELYKKNIKVRKKLKLFAKEDNLNIEDTKPQLKKDFDLIIKEENAINKIKSNPNLNSQKNLNLINEYFKDYRLKSFDTLVKVKDETIYVNRENILKKLGYTEMEKDKEFFKMELNSCLMSKSNHLTDRDKEHKKVRKLIGLSNEKKLHLLWKVDNFLIKKQVN